MLVLAFLIIFPLVAAFGMLILRESPARAALIRISAAIIALGSIILVITNLGTEIQFFSARSVFADRGMFFIELILAAYIFYAGFKYKKPLTSGIIVIQTAIMAYFEIFLRHNLVIENNLFIDRLSLIMTLVIGVIGSLVAVYAIEYMRDFHKGYHKEVKDNRGFFFFVMFAFLFAMFGIVFSNNLLWLYFFWELTSLASFFLIGYTETDKARKHAFWALELNLLAGLVFSVTIVYLYFNARVIELNKIISLGKSVALMPAALLCFSGLVKCAQFPFASWLIGAMVGPAPASALLHSSTMVKAGVYMILRFALVLEGTLTGFMLGMIGGITFLLGSFIGVSRQDSKEVLAYSTVANLGLIVLCASVGTYEAVWAALLLIMFHAVGKGLLFMCVGAVDNQIRSVNIEDMSGLIVRMPKVSIIMQIGIAGMFVAPFGMLISKWAALQALVDYNPVLAVFVVFGSSAMIFFWVKWIGKLITVTRAAENIENRMNMNEWIPLFAMAFLTVGLCLFFPLICKILVEPYLVELYAKTVSLGGDNIAIMTIMLAMIMLFPLTFINYGKGVKVVGAYLGGANTGSGTEFRAASGGVRKVEMKNYYLLKYFPESRLNKFGVVIAVILLTAAVVLAAK